MTAAARLQASSREGAQPRRPGQRPPGCERVPGKERSFPEEDGRKGKGMKKLKYRCGIWRQLHPFFSGARTWYGGEILSDVGIQVITLLFPVFYGILLEKVILAKDLSRLSWVVSGYVLLQLAGSGLHVFQRHCRNRVNDLVYRKVRVTALDKYFHLRFDAYDGLQVGDVKMTLEDGVNKLSVFHTQLYRYCINSIFIVIMTATLFGISWRLALIALPGIPLTFLLDHLVSRREKKVNEILNRNDASWATWLDETLKGWKEIRVNKCEAKRKKEFEDFSEVDETYFMTWLRFWTTRVLVIPKLKDEFIMQFVLYFAGGTFLYYRQLSIGALLIFVRYYGILSNSVKEASASDANLQSEMPHYERILNHLSRTWDIDAEGTVMPESFDVAFENVTFGYGGTGRNVLENLSFSIREGDRVGFYGESGAGKSTLLKLMTGQLEPTGGTVTYGGTPLKDICKKELYQRIAHISQEARLYDRSVLENLRMGKGNASMEEVEAACRRACIHDFITSLPDGFQTVIGENGALLSGGQRQRLLLAKALLRDADLYILDEATSALDNQVEEHVKESLNCIPRNKTVIVVAHKKSFLEVCDYRIRIEGHNPSQDALPRSE